MGKEKKSKKEKKGEHKKEHKKHSKSSKKHSRAKRDSGSDSDSSSSGSLLETETPAAELARVRRATACLRRLLGQHPAARAHLRQLLFTVDAGQAADLTAVSDAGLCASMEELLQALRLRQLRPHVWGLPTGAARGLATVGFVFDEPAHVHQAAAAAASAAAEPPPSAGPPRPTLGPQRPPAPEADSPQPADGPEGLDEAAEEEEDGGPIGPAMPRLLGPAMPPRELLDAAAAATAADEEDFVGPPPPEAVEEDLLARPETREDAARLVLKRLAAGDAYTVMGLAPSCTAAEVKKAYWRLSLLVHPDKCSHPQAQDAFQALKDAQMALSDPARRAALDDAREYEKWKEERAQERAFARQQAEWRRIRGQPEPGDDALLAGGAADGAPEAPPSREEWMTTLPPERQARAPQAGVSTTTFAQGKGSIVPRGDGHGWTDTPQQALERAQGRLMGATGPWDAKGAGSGGGGGGGGASGALLALMDSMAAQARPKSLVELHQERMAAAAAPAGGAKRKAAAPAAATAQPAGAGGGAAGAAYRPFDRERDLAAGSAAALAIKKAKLNPAAAAQLGQGGLSGRFASGSGGVQRSFL